MIVTFRLSSLGTGGAERVFISVATALVRMHDIVVHFVVDRRGDGELEDVVEKLGFQVFGLCCSRTAGSIFPLKNYIENYCPDVLISAYTDTNMAMLLSATMARRKCALIVSEHASLDEHWRHASWKRRKLLNMYVCLGYRLADHVIAVSEGIVKQVNRRLNVSRKVSCIYNPVRFDGSDKASAPGFSNRRAARKTILAVGRIAQPKDYLTLLQAFNQVAKSEDVRLVIVGAVQDLKEKSRLDDYLSHNDLWGKVEFAGFSEQVQKFYRTADLFVLSSAWEGFGNVLVEALAFGLPIVSTDCNHGPAEILSQGKYGTLVPVGDADALAAAICDRLNAPEPDRDALRQRSREFSEARIGAQYWELISKLVAQ